MGFAAGAVTGAVLLRQSVACQSAAAVGLGQPLLLGTALVPGVPRGRLARLAGRLREVEAADVCRPRRRARSSQARNIPTLLAREMTSNNKPKQPKQKPRPKMSKLSKKERMKQELLGHIGSDFDALAQDAQVDRVEDDPMFETYEQQARQSIGQMANNAKLRPDDELTLREFCDLIWRAANWSPLDPDEKQDDEEEKKTKTQSEL
ncbi:unnamed protein product [Prorocentrum cordatum]|uniref:Ribosome assembly protein 3 n=1 Tax=Prorocentrum cordatum TaxID=2364126 RepID=A0ABN9U1K6_9DINO|nr:unnamed protein product [Polarella glacialis]